MKHAPLTLVHLCQDGVSHHPIYILFRQVGRAEDSGRQSTTVHLGQSVGASCRDVFFKVNVTIESFIIRFLPCGSSDRRMSTALNYRFLLHGTVQYVSVYECTCVHTYIHIYIHTYICTYYEYSRIYICTYIHTLSVHMCDIHLRLLQSLAG